VIDQQTSRPFPQLWRPPIARLEPALPPSVYQSKWPGRAVPHVFGSPTRAVNDKGRYCQFRARPPESIVCSVVPVTEIPEASAPSSRTPRCSYGRSVAKNDCQTSALKDSVPGLLKQTSIIIHDLSWQARRKWRPYGHDPQLLPIKGTSCTRHPDPSFVRVARFPPETTSTS